jgi:hypothetical protein
LDEERSAERSAPAEFRFPQRGAFSGEETRFLTKAEFYRSAEHHMVYCNNIKNPTNPSSARAKNGLRKILPEINRGPKRKIKFK